MDGVGCGPLVEAWKQEIKQPNSCELYTETDPASIFNFTKKVDISDGWRAPGWIGLSPRFILGDLYVMRERYANPLLDGSIYIPSAMLTGWKKLAIEEMQPEDFVSSNDLITAWLFKYAWGTTFHGDEHWNTLFTAICARGRHPALPLSMITNTAKSHVIPPMRTKDLRAQSLGQIALRIRKSLQPFSDEDFVAKFVTEEYRRVKKWNGFPTTFPNGRADARVCGVTSWARQGLGNFAVRDVKPISCLTYNAERRVASIIDTVDDWRLDYKLSARQWNALKVQMVIENKALEA